MYCGYVTEYPFSENIQWSIWKERNIKYAAYFQLTKYIYRKRDDKSLTKKQDKMLTINESE